MEQKNIKNYELPISAKKIMDYLHDLIEIDNFILYGGAPVDLTINKKSKINDYDIAIRGKEQNKIEHVIDVLINNNFEIIEPGRKYYIYHNVEVVLVYAKKNTICLDICFMDDIESVGQYNLESLYWQYPEMMCIDNFDAVKCIENKEIIPIRVTGAENIFLLISRFIYLCSKYNISLSTADNIKIIKNFKNQLIKERERKSDKYISCLSSILKSVLKADNRALFIQTLLDTKLLEILFSSMQYSLQKIMINEFGAREIREAKNKHDLAAIMSRYLPREDRYLFKETLMQISQRKWDAQDVELSSNIYSC